MTTNAQTHDRKQVTAELTIAATELEEATRNRDTAIVRARLAGLSLRDIATAAGINHQTVANIVDRAGARP